MIKHQRGFSLIELSMVMIIGGILLAGAISIGSAQLENARISSTQKKQEVIKIALMAFISINRRFPCPAIANLSEGAVGYGKEAQNQGTCTGTTRISGATASDHNVRGVIPWQTLNLSDGDGVDGYGRRFTYQVRLNQTSPIASDSAGFTGNIDILDERRNKVIDDAVTAVILSHGNDGYGAYLPVTGARMNRGPTTADDTLENNDDDREYVQKSYSMDENDPFDDIISWLNPSFLNYKLIEMSVLTSPSSSINQGFDSIFNAAGQVSGNQVPFADCSSSRNPNGRSNNNCTSGITPWVTLSVNELVAKDPWGNHIRYNRDSTTTITLTSWGADSTQGTADDVTSTKQVK